MRNKKTNRISINPSRRHRWLIDDERFEHDAVITEWYCPRCLKRRIIVDQDFRTETYMDEDGVIETQKTPLCFEPGEGFEIKTNMVTREVYYNGKGQYEIHQTIDGWQSCIIDEQKLANLRQGKINFLDLNFE